MGWPTGSGGVSPLLWGAPAPHIDPNSATIPCVFLGKSQLHSILFFHPELFNGSSRSDILTFFSDASQQGSTDHQILSIHCVLRTY